LKFQSKCTFLILSSFRDIGKPDENDEEEEEKEQH